MNYTNISSKPVGPDCLANASCTEIYAGGVRCTYCSCHDGLVRLEIPRDVDRELFDACVKDGRARGLSTNWDAAAGPYHVLERLGPAPDLRPLGIEAGKPATLAYAPTADARPKTVTVHTRACVGCGGVDAHADDCTSAIYMSRALARLTDVPALDQPGPFRLPGFVSPAQSIADDIADARDAARVLVAACDPRTDAEGVILGACDALVAALRDLARLCGCGELPAPTPLGDRHDSPEQARRRLALLPARLLRTHEPWTLPDLGARAEAIAAVAVVAGAAAKMAGATRG